MRLYLCRWENGDFSVVQAKNKEHAIEMLDEEANAEGLPLYEIADFMVHFRLSDEGNVELEGFGEEFDNYMRERVHPILGELDVSPYDAGPEERFRIKKAVERERCRLKAKPASEPDTELGKRIKVEMDLPTSVIAQFRPWEQSSGHPLQWPDNMAGIYISPYFSPRDWSLSESCCPIEFNNLLIYSNPSCQH